MKAVQKKYQKSKNKNNTGKIVLVTGGARSGKSAYAQRLAETLAGPRAFIATCPVTDDEMRRRIRAHQRARKGGQFETIEEPVNLAAVLRRGGKYRVLLVDCLTLWVNNLLFEAAQRGRELDEAEIVRQSQAVLAACRRLDAHVIFVTNEVGLGIVPENALARRFRDLAGRCNQVFAAGAAEVTLLVSGLPLNLKKGKQLT